MILFEDLLRRNLIGCWTEVYSGRYGDPKKNKVRRWLTTDISDFGTHYIFASSGYLVREGNLWQRWGGTIHLVLYEEANSEIYVGPVELPSSEVMWLESGMGEDAEFFVFKIFPKGVSLPDNPVVGKADLEWFESEFELV